jgi:hypothetical protein
MIAFPFENYQQEPVMSTSAASGGRLWDLSHTHIFMNEYRFSVSFPSIAQFQACGATRAKAIMVIDRSQTASICLAERGQPLGKIMAPSDAGLEITAGVWTTERSRSFESIFSNI